MFGKEISEQKLAILLVIPALLVIIAINFYPIIRSLYESFFDIRGITNHGYIGLENYINLFRSERTWSSIWATAYFGFGTIFFQTIMGLIFALALNKSFKGRKILRSLVVIPWAIPSALAALMWRRFFAATDGYVNATLRAVGLLEGTLAWFGRPFLALTVVIWVDTWKTTPLYILVFLAGLQAIPKHYYEAAKVEGASKVQSFFYITLPILKPVIIIVVILRTMLVLHAFAPIHILTGGGPGDATRVLSYHAYQESFQYLRQGRGAAMAILIFFLTAIIVILYLKALRYEQ